MISVVLLTAAPLFFEGAARVEGAAGFAPSRPNGAPEPVTMWTFTPTVALTRPRALGRSELRYAARLLLREPNLLGLHRPLLLHIVSLAERGALSPRTALTLRLGGSFGEVDYLSIRTALPAQTTGASTPVVKIGTLAGEAALTHRLGPLSTIEAGAFGDQLSTYGEGLPLDTSQLGARIVNTRQLDRRVQLRWPAQVTIVRASALPTTVLLTVRVGGTYAVDVRTEAEAEVGFAAAQSSTGGALALNPELRLGWRRRTSLARGMPLAFGALASVNTRVDRLRGALLPVGGVELDAELGVGRWTTRAMVSAFTSVTPRPLIADQPESAVFATLSARRPLPPALAVEVGVRGSVRAPHPAGDGPWTEATALGFGALSWGISSDPHYAGP